MLFISLILSGFMLFVVNRAKTYKGRILRAVCFVPISVCFVPMLCWVVFSIAYLVNVVFVFVVVAIAAAVKWEPKRIRMATLIVTVVSYLGFMTYDMIDRRALQSQYPAFSLADRLITDAKTNIEGVERRLKMNIARP